MNLSHTERFCYLVTDVFSISIEFMEDFWGETLLVFPTGCNHTRNLFCLPTCLGKVPDDCSIHACSWFSGKPSKIHPCWTKTWSSYWSRKRKIQKIALNISAICTKMTSFWSHRSTVFVMDDCERRKQPWNTNVFVKRCTHTAATKQRELMYCSNDCFSCFNLEKNKLLSWIKTTQTHFYSFEIFKRIPAHTVYKKEAKQI